MGCGHRLLLASSAGLERSDKLLPDNTCFTKVGNVSSASPEKTASTNLYEFKSSAPISPSQFAPPNAMTTCGAQSLIRFASASEARCCWNELEKPTILKSDQHAAWKHSSMNAGTFLRCCKNVSTLDTEDLSGYSRCSTCRK